MTWLLGPCGQRAIFLVVPALAVTYGGSLRSWVKPLLSNEDLFLSQMPEEAPFSRRFGLQKTGSSGALGPSERRGTEGVLGLQRSASSSLLEKASSQVGVVKCVGSRLLPWGREYLLCFSPVPTGQGAPSCQNNPYPCPESARALYPVSTRGWGRGTGLVLSWNLRS